MKKNLFLLFFYGVVPLSYGMESEQLIKPKKIGIFSAINQRKQQEDFFYHDIVDGGHLYAVCDGHYCHRVGEHNSDDCDGSIISKFVAENFHDYFIQTSGSIQARMKEAFKAIDESEFVKQNGACGSSSVVVFIKDNKAHVAHIGDSRAVLARGSDVVLTTHDHKPDRADEYVRIEDAKGMVFNHRVNGFLSVSRAIGDYNLGKNLVIAKPDYQEIELGHEDRFLILGSNGLWNFVSNEEAACILHAKQSQVQDMNLLAKMLGMFAVTRNSKDNITVMLVDLLS
jgi:serine/threonine protein phosphatase PrpC